MQNIFYIILAYIKGLISKIPTRVWIEIISAGILIGLALTFYLKYYHTHEELEVSENNNIAYQSQLESATNSIIQFQFTVDQLNYFNDSVSNKLKTAIKESGVKDKKIKELQYMLSNFEKKDTVRLHDTVFCDPDFYLDTIIGDEWMNTRLILEYPDRIRLGTFVKSEKTVILHSEKVTVDPPKKFFLCRWFQKKQTVIKAEILEHIPYITNAQSLFIQTDPK